MHSPDAEGMPFLQEWMTGGVGVGDFNADGCMDVYWVGGGGVPEPKVDLASEHESSPVFGRGFDRQVIALQRSAEIPSSLTPLALSEGVVDTSRFLAGCNPREEECQYEEGHLLHG